MDENKHLDGIKLNENLRKKRIVKYEVQTPGELRKRNGRVISHSLVLIKLLMFHVIYQTRATVFHGDIQTARKRVENTTRNGVFLTKFEVFG